jgi:hypothetical protein
MFCHAESHFMLSVTKKPFLYAECRYAECHYAECRYAECSGATTKCHMNDFEHHFQRKMFCHIGTQSFSTPWGNFIKLFKAVIY